MSAKELEPILSFSCRNAECFKPSDRAFVLGSIREEFGSEANFDKFVVSREVSNRGRSFMPR